MKIKDYINHTFESSTRNTSEFKKFARRFRKEVKDMFTDNTTFIFNTGHFYLSGFIQNPFTKKWAYFSVSDVRHFPNEFYNNILVRSAENESDFTGGCNRYTTFDQFLSLVSEITAENSSDYPNGQSQTF
mgnify:CR=1 FL=1